MTKSSRRQPPTFDRGEQGAVQVDVIIPTYRPTDTFLQLLKALAMQTLVPQNVIVINTNQDALEACIRVDDMLRQYPFVRLIHITERDFDHAATRRYALEHSEAPFFVMMTQDALPANHLLLETLWKALERQPDAAAAYARQLPRKGASEEEAFERYFNYPPQSRRQTKEQITTYGFKTFYCSDVCAMYRRSLYEKNGGFPQRAIFNEDVLFASAAIRNGYSILYEAQAKVIHSHGYTCMQLLRRSFDQGVSQAMNKETFARVPQEGEGMRLVKTCTIHLVRKGKLLRIPYFYLKCAIRLLGYYLGKGYRKLPRRCNRWLSMNKTFFV